MDGEAKHKSVKSGYSEGLCTDKDTLYTSFSDCVAHSMAWNPLFFVGVLEHTEICRYGLWVVPDGVELAVAVSMGPPHLRC